MKLRIRNRIDELRRPSPHFPRAYLPNDLQVNAWESIEPYFNELLNRKLDSMEDLQSWLIDGSELQSVVGEEAARRYIAMTCATDNQEAEKRFLDFLENIQPRIKPLADKLNHKLVDSPYAEELIDRRYGVLLRSARNSIELFREENIAIETEIEKLSQQYQKISAAQSVTFRGKEHTLQQMGVYLEETDRELRREAWELATKRRLEDAEKLDEILDKMLELRGQVAKNAGFDNFRDYQFRAYERFDYTPADCLQFHAAVERYVVPVVREMMEERRQAMGLASLRPWDTTCDAQGRAALHPFENTDQLAEGSLEVFKRLDGELADNFRQMIEYGLLDLDSRKGKAPGGYQQDLGENRLPFIFMNAVGINRDVFTMLHEGGHAFHHFAVQPEPLMPYRHAPIEFSEVASMSMELLGMPYLDVFYSPEQHARTMRDEWERKLAFFPWCVTIDAFQHWLYTHPGHSRKERGDYWEELTARFGSGIDHSGYEDALRYRWQAQLHIFEVPFYYIEYGIAQLGAMQVWSNSLMDERAALGSYKNALKLGGSRPLPELFRAANIEFDFTEETLNPLMAQVREELGRLAQLEKETAAEATD